MEALKALMKDFDPAALMPDLDTVLGKLEGIIRLAVMVAPLVLLGLGLLYLLAPPKEANYKLGYRFFWGMSSVEAWRFTQRLAGVVFSAMGLIFLIVMLVISGGFGDLGEMEMVTTTVNCLLWQVGLAFAGYFGVALTAFVLFDRTGAPRRRNKKSARV